MVVSCGLLPFCDDNTFVPYDIILESFYDSSKKSLPLQSLVEDIDFCVDCFETECLAMSRDLCCMCLYKASKCVHCIEREFLEYEQAHLDQCPYCIYCLIHKDEQKQATIVYGGHSVCLSCYRVYILHIGEMDVSVARGNLEN
jgi:hypothetical protein